MVDRAASPVWIKPLFTWRSAIAESDLKPVTKHVALTLSLHMSERGDSCFPGKSLLSGETGLDVRTVDRSLKELGEKRWLEVDRGGGRGRSNRYRAKIPRSFPRATYFIEREQDTEQPRQEAGDCGKLEEKPRQESGVRDLNGGTDAETPAQDTVNPGTVPGEDVSSSTESKGARAREEPRVKIPDLPTVEHQGKLKYLWGEMWERLNKSSSDRGVRYTLPGGLTIDLTTVAHPDYESRRSRLVIIWRDKMISEYPPSELAAAMLKFDKEKKTFWRHVFSDNGQLAKDWIEGSASGYPSFHTSWRERWPKSS